MVDSKKTFYTNAHTSRVHPKAKLWPDLSDDDFEHFGRVLSNVVQGVGGEVGLSYF